MAPSKAMTDRHGEIDILSPNNIGCGGVLFGGTLVAVGFEENTRDTTIVRVPISFNTCRCILPIQSGGIPSVCSPFELVARHPAALCLPRRPRAWTHRLSESEVKLGVWVLGKLAKSKISCLCFFFFGRHQNPCWFLGGYA